VQREDLSFYYFVEEKLSDGLRFSSREEDCMTVPMNEPVSQPAPSITEADAPPTVIKQSFKCEKCGATFEDEGSATAHIQD
jgi:hypothetical protein